jgi:hypothetical protein
LELSLKAIVDDIKSNIGHQEKFDAAIIIIRITDYRASINEVIACRAIKEFLENLTPQHIFCLITHCDL